MPGRQPSRSEEEKPKQDSTPSKEYPRSAGMSKDRMTFYYKLPVGLTFKQVEEKLDVFKSAFKLKNVTLEKLKDDALNDFSITISDQ